MKKTRQHSLVLTTILAMQLCMSPIAQAETETLTLADKTDISFSHSPEMTFSAEVTDDGIVIEFQGVPKSPNWMRANIPCLMTAPEKGELEIEYRSEYPMNRYFAVDLISVENKKYSARLGSQDKGYRFSAMKSVATVPLTDLKAEDGTTIPAFMPIAQINLVMTSSPETEMSKVHIYEIRLVSNDN